MAEYLTPAHGCIHLGDMISGEVLSHTGVNPLSTLANQIKPTKPLFGVLGNHDEQGNKNTTTITVTEATTAMIQHLNTNTIYSSRGYGYYDFEDQKIRLIILNSFDYPATTANDEYVYRGANLLFQQDQINMFIDALDTVPDNDYTVVLAMHWPEKGIIDDTIIPQHVGIGPIAPQLNELIVGYGTYMSGGSDTDYGLVISEIIEAYKARGSISQTYSYSSGGQYTGTVTVNKNFSSAKGTFSVCIAGHRHKECVAKSAVGDYWIYVMDTSSCGTITSGGSQSSPSNIPRSPNTNARDLMSCMSIDPINKLVKFTRIGAHINRFFEDSNFLTLSYGDE